jgi:hypothetical protein
MSKAIPDVELLRKNQVVGASFSHHEQEFIATLSKCAALQKKLLSVNNGTETLKEKHHLSYIEELDELEKHLRDSAKKLIDIATQVSSVSKEITKRSLISMDPLQKSMNEIALAFGNINPSATDINLSQMAAIVEDAQTIIKGHRDYTPLVKKRELITTHFTSPTTTKYDVLPSAISVSPQALSGRKPVKRAERAQ